MFMHIQWHTGNLAQILHPSPAAGWCAWCPLSGFQPDRTSAATGLTFSCLVHFSLQGLDPASRRNLWDVIKRQRAGRGIILTTHNMEEAEVHSNLGF